MIINKKSAVFAGYCRPLLVGMWEETYSFGFSPNPYSTSSLTTDVSSQMLSLKNLLLPNLENLIIFFVVYMVIKSDIASTIAVFNVVNQLFSMS